MFWFKSKKNALKNIRVVPPEPLPGRHGLAIAVCMRDEGPYVEEWIRYHSAVGVRHFVVYDNGSIDDTCELLRNALRPDALTIIPWAGQMFQKPDDTLIDGQALAFAHAITNFGGSFGRMAFIDVDEFLLPKVGRTIEEALAFTAEFPNVSLPWHMFGPGGHVGKPLGPVILNYFLRTAKPLSRLEHSTNFKCIVDPCEVVEVSVHQFKTRRFGDLTVNDAGRSFSRRDRKSSEFYSNHFLQLNHYYSKSIEEMRTKISRGSNYANSPEKLKEKMLTTLENIELNTIEDKAMIEFVELYGITAEILGPQAAANIAAQE